MKLILLAESEKIEENMRGFFDDYQSEIYHAVGKQAKLHQSKKFWWSIHSDIYPDLLTHGMHKIGLMLRIESL